MAFPQRSFWHSQLVLTFVGGLARVQEKVSPFDLPSDLGKKSIQYISVPDIMGSKYDSHLIRLGESNMVFL